MSNSPAASTTPDVMYSGSEYVFAWAEQGAPVTNIHVAALVAGGPVRGPAVVNTARFSNAPTLALAGSQYAVGYTESGSPFHDLGLVVFDPRSFMAASPPAVVDTPGDDLGPSMLWTGTDFVIAWRGQPGPGPAVMVVDSDASILTAPRSLGSIAHEGAPVLIAADGGYTIAFAGSVGADIQAYLHHFCL